MRSTEKELSRREIWGKREANLRTWRKRNPEETGMGVSQRNPGLEISADPGDLHVPPDPVAPSPSLRASAPPPSLLPLPSTSCCHHSVLLLQNVSKGLPWWFQWLRLLVCHCRGCLSWIPRLGSKIPYAKGQKKRGEGRENTGPPTVLESLIPASPV